MADEIEPSKPAAIPSPPEPFTIPIALVEQWGEIPNEARLNFPLTRQDIDHLLVGLLKGLEAQAIMDQSMIHWSHGRLDEANVALAEFRRKNGDAQNSIRQFISSVMASALRERKNG